LKAKSGWLSFLQMIKAKQKIEDIDIATLSHYIDIIYCIFAAQMAALGPKNLPFDLTQCAAKESI